MKTDVRHISAEDVLRGQVSAAEALDLDLAHGNPDFVRSMQLLNIAGPFSVASPWEWEDKQGARYINASGYSALAFGDAHPELLDFLHRYLTQNREVGFPQQSITAWRATLANNLVALLAEAAPSHASSEVHFSNSGSEAIENAIKFVRANRPGARYVINFRGAYHGHTLMALSLTPKHHYQDPFMPMVGDIVTVDFGDLDALEKAISRCGPKNVAAVVLEPVQGEAGVIIPPIGYLEALGRLCRSQDILVVADEIQTALGRTGHWFESLAQGLEPDIIAFGKALSGGLAPIGVTIARRELCRSAVGGLGADRLISTYSGNSLVMAIALKALDLLIEQDLPNRALALGRRGLERLRAIQARHEKLIEEVRGAGMLFAMQLRPVFTAPLSKSQGDAIGELTSALGLRALHDAGVLGNMALNTTGVLRLSPALTMPEELFEEMWSRVERAADLNTPAWRLVTHAHLRTLLGFATLSRATAS